MLNWAKKNLPKITVECFTDEEVDQIIIEQEDRFQNIEPLVGITSYQAIIPQSLTSVLMKKYSESEKTKLMYLVKTKGPWHLGSPYVNLF